jgi:hypothetical protein
MMLKHTHKLSLLFTFVYLFVGANCFSQTLKEFFSNNATHLTYLGIDYTQNIFYKNADADPSDIRDRYYPGMNDLVIKEQVDKSYDIAAAFNRKNAISIDISAVTVNNKNIDAGKIISSSKADFRRLKEADIANCVAALNLDGKDGIGLVFVMEGMKKVTGKGYGAIWITLIDMKTKQVLMTQRLEREAEGFSFRNYWVSVIRKTISEIDWSKYKEWKKKYGR